MPHSSLSHYAIRMINTWLPVAVQDGSNVEARSQMLTASAMAAVAFQKGLGGVHGLSEPIGAVHNTQHGLTNAVLLPHVLVANKSVIEEKCGVIVQCVGLQTNGDTPPYLIQCTLITSSHPPT